jgi:hypothetical protein
MAARFLEVPRGFVRALPAAILAVAALSAPASLAAQGATQGAAARPDSASFITRLGNDTLAVERFVRTGQRFEAEVVLRSPSISRTRYVMETSATGGLVRLETVVLDPRSGTPTGRRSLITLAGDSLRIETTVNGETTTRTAPAAGAVLPFIDMVHWPFELALTRARSGGSVASGAELPQPMLSGNRVSTFRVGIVGADSMTITHPSRGTMRVRVDELGRLLTLDAGATTRKLIVERGRWLAVEPFAVRWAELDASGRSFGALSGRGEAESTVHGATITVDYGTPLKRGRSIWGVLVPFGEVWRTGANQATHFTTDRDLVFGSGAGELLVPAGEYTLFSIPAADGGILIINRQTGQTGTAYNAERDLGRVPLTARALAEEVEVFTISITETARGGELRLQWDRTELVAPFVVRGR